MNILVPQGKYVLAVSGGVDSMVLMDILRRLDDVEIIVAHLNHGIRPDSIADEELVVKIANKHGLVIETGTVNLGASASEEQARQARYRFLNEVKDKHQANGIVTAHHQDDLIETAIINILRGTGPRGVVAMEKNDEIIRPLLGIPKSRLLQYAKKNDIKWREDTSNTDLKYLRNYIRHNLMPRLSKKDRKTFLSSINSISKSQEHSQKLIAVLADEVKKGVVIDRAKFISLPGEIGSELLVFWMRDMSVKDFDRNTVIRLSLALKTARAGTKHDVVNGVWLEVGQKTARFRLNR